MKHIIVLPFMMLLMAMTTGMTQYKGLSIGPSWAPVNTERACCVRNDTRPVVIVQQPVRYRPYQYIPPLYNRSYYTPSDGFYYKFKVSPSMTIIMEDK